MPLPMMPRPMKPNLSFDATMFFDFSVSVKVETSSSVGSGFKKISGRSMTARAARERGSGDAVSFLANSVLMSLLLWLERGAAAAVRWRLAGGGVSSSTDDFTGETALVFFCCMSRGRIKLVMAQD